MNAPRRTGGDASPRPMFFGPEGARRFGVLHQAPGTTRLGLVVCQPSGDEAPDTLRALRLIAAQAASRGVTAFRFDWYATGDSEGNCHDARLEHWTEDVAYAAETLRRESDVTAVALLGVRLGGTIATLAAPAIDDVVGLALWEPVDDGRAFMDAKRRHHREWVAIEARERPESRGYSVRDELLGYAMPPQLESAIRSLTLSRSPGRLASRGLVVRNGARREEGRWIGALRRGLDEISEVHVDESPVWDASAGLDAAPVPARTIAAIVDWVAGLSGPSHPTRGTGGGR